MCMSMGMGYGMYMGKDKEMDMNMEKAANKIFENLNVQTVSNTLT